MKKVMKKFYYIHDTDKTTGDRDPREDERVPFNLDFIPPIGTTVWLKEQDYLYIVFGHSICHASNTLDIDIRRG